MEVKFYNHLHEDVCFIRTEVFIKEQHFAQELDEKDAISTYLVIYEQGRPIGTARFYKVEDTRYVMGRVAVMRDARGRGIGKRLVEQAETYIREAGGTEIRLSAQVRVQGFYEKLGYQSEGEPYLDEYCPHMAMKKCLR